MKPPQCLSLVCAYDVCPNKKKTQSIKKILKNGMRNGILLLLGLRMHTRTPICVQSECFGRIMCICFTMSLDQQKLHFVGYCCSAFSGLNHYQHQSTIIDIVSEKLEKAVVHSDVIFAS